MSNTVYTLSASDTAERIGVTEQTVRRWAHTGKLRHVVLPSGQLRFSEADLQLVLTPVEPSAS